MSDLIQCEKCNKEQEKLKEPPFPFEIGDKIFNEICSPCFNEWVNISINYLNEYQLDLTNPDDTSKYDQIMEEFLFGAKQDY